jgi:hypothetical protein
LSVIDVLGQDRTDRVGQHQLGLRRQRGEGARQAGHGARAAAAEHDGVQVAVHLFQDLRAGAELVGGRIVRVAELVDEVRARGFLGHALGHVLVVLRVALGDVRAGQAHFGAHRLEVEDLLAAHLVGHDQDQLVALLLGHQRQAQAGIAGGALDQGRARLQFATLLGGLDHRQADAVLDGSPGIGAFELQVQLADTGIQALGLDDRGLANEVEYGGVDCHRVTSIRAATRPDPRLSDR